MDSLVRRVGVLCVGFTLVQAGVTQAAGQQGSDPATKRRANVTRAAFGRMPDGQAVELFTLTNARGLEARVISYGGTIVSLRVPDRAGKLADVVLGHDNLDGYLQPSGPYFGAIIGRYGNRIAKAQFTLDGSTYKLAANNGPNNLHGGLRGFDKVVWKAEPFEKPDACGIVFSHTSPDGDEGFPGTLQARVVYTLTDAGELSFEYTATTDKPTHVNLTQHTYFNLAGDGSGDVLKHELMLAADRYTPVDATLIPTGELAPVAGTPLDFRRPFVIGARIGESHPQLERGKGYDHNFVVNRSGEGLVLAARVSEPTTGRVMEVRTTEPGVQLYTGNFLDGVKGKSGAVYRQRFGFCLETQHFPDSPNQAAFPSTVLRPGQTYRSKTVLAFSTSK